MWRGGRCTRGGVPTFSTVHHSSSFGARWWQRGSLPPGRAGWVAVGVGSQAGLLSTLPPAPSPASFPIWGVEAWGPASQLQGAPLRGCRAPKASGGVGSGRLMAFALSGERALQTPGFSQTQHAPRQHPTTQRPLHPASSPAPVPAYLGGPLAGVEEQLAVPEVRPQHSPGLPPHNAIAPNPTSPGGACLGRPAPPRPPLCLPVQGRALLPSAGLGGHLAGAGESGQCPPVGWAGRHSVAPTRCRSWASQWRRSETKPTAT